MKNTVRFVGVLLGVSFLFISSARAELLAEFFDEFEMGAITNQEEWTAFSNSLSGIVTNTQAHSGAQSVLLPVPPGNPAETTSSMLLSAPDAYVWSTNDHPVFRISAQIFCERRDQTVTLSGEYNQNEKLQVVLDGTSGHVHLDGTDTGISFVTNKFVDVVLYYNMSTDQASLDYNGTNIQTWVDMSGSVATQFNEIGVSRESGSGAVYVDDLFVEVFPASTVGWWRFEEGSGSRTAERTGRFPATSLSIWNGHKEWQEASTDLGYTGREDIPMQHAFSGPNLDTVTNTLSTIVMTNWTFEGVLKIQPEADFNAQFISTGVGWGFNTTNSYLSISWQSDHSNLSVSVHDNGQSTTDSDWVNNYDAKIPADGDWHHFAVVKTNDLIITYLDYRPMTTNGLTSIASGVYEFGSDSVVRIGVTLNNANDASEYHFFDEIRLSSGVLETKEFLQASRPFIETFPTGSPGSTLEYTFMSIPGFNYHLQYTSGLGEPTVWSNSTATSATDHISSLSMPRPAGRSLFVRVVRD